jgi:arginine exporter protein ArgO
MLQSFKDAAECISFSTLNPGSYMQSVSLLTAAGNSLFIKQKEQLPALRYGSGCLYLTTTHVLQSAL